MRLRNWHLGLLLAFIPSIVEPPRLKADASLLLQANINKVIVVDCLTTTTPMACFQRRHHKLFIFIGKFVYRSNDITLFTLIDGPFKERKCVIYQLCFRLYFCFRHEFIKLSQLLWREFDLYSKFSIKFRHLYYHLNHQV